MSTHELGFDQKKALDDLHKFITTDDHYAHVLIGVAGTGKTTLTKEFTKIARKLGLQVLAVAPTHKARKVLHHILNTNFMLKIPTITVASLLGKSRKHGYIGTHNYSIDQDHKMALYDIIIVDEVSMLVEDDYNCILALICELHKKVLFIGDDAQIPNPSQKLVLRSDSSTLYYEKADIKAFTDLPASRLIQVMRQTQGSDLLTLCQYIHSNIGSDIQFNDSSNFRSSGESYTMHDACSFLQEIKKLDLSADILVNRRIITYTNVSVNGYNKIIREARKYKEIIHVDDLLTGYNNVGLKNDLLIENGQDYIVVKKEHVDTQTNGIDTTGIKVTVKEPMAAITRVLYFPDLYDERNNILLEKLVELATKVNSNGSTKIDYKHYMCLKNQVIFQENIYHYKSHVTSESSVLTGSEMQAQHPLLFVHTVDVINDKGMINNSDEALLIMEKYPGLLESRIQDNKSLSSSETLADQFQVIEKDIDYGYAITAHKSQGSTYDIAYVDLLNFQKLHDSTYKGIPVNRSRERDQLRYVAISRARKYVHILCKAH